MSIMTEIRDRLMASGDTEAAHALDHACFAARDRLDALDEMRKDVAAKDTRIASLEAQAKDWARYMDIRNASLKEVSDRWDESKARLAALEETVAKAFLRCQELEEATMKLISALDDFAGELSIPVLDAARDLHNLIAALCHASPVPGGETSSAEGPPQSGDGEGR